MSGYPTPEFDKTWFERMWESWTMRLQAFFATAAAIWLALPADLVQGIIPTKYAAYGALGCAILTAIARMRSL